MSTYAYVRVSDASQHEDRQMIAMDEMGIPQKNIFLDKQSGKNTARPGLQRLMARVERGDTIIVESVSRFHHGFPDQEAENQRRGNPPIRYKIQSAYKANKAM